MAVIDLAFELTLAFTWILESLLVFIMPTFLNIFSLTNLADLKDYDEDLEQKNACFLALKKFKSIKKSDQNKINKVKQNLLSKGYSFDYINFAVSKLNE